MGEHVAEPEPGIPAEVNAVVNPMVRTVVYLVCLGVNVATILVLGLMVIFNAIESVQALAAGGLITGVLGTVASGLGVAYRPTKLESHLQP